MWSSFHNKCKSNQHAVHPLFIWEICQLFLYKTDKVPQLVYLILLTVVSAGGKHMAVMNAGV